MMLLGNKGRKIEPEGRGEGRRMAEKGGEGKMEGRGEKEEGREKGRRKGGKRKRGEENWEWILRGKRRVIRPLSIWKLEASVMLRPM